VTLEDAGQVDVIRVRAEWIEDDEVAAYALASRKFPEEAHKEDLRGGTKIMYLEGETVISRLNEVFAYGWDFEILEDGINEDADEAWCRGRLTVWRKVQERSVVITETENGSGLTTSHQVTTYTETLKPVRREQYGSQKLKRARSTGKILDIGFDKKGAATDALKKCASLDGIGLYLWNKEERAVMAMMIQEARQQDQGQQANGGNAGGQPQGQGRFRRVGSGGGGQQDNQPTAIGNAQKAIKINGIEMPAGFQMPFQLVMSGKDRNECCAKDCEIVVNPAATYKVGNDSKTGEYVLSRAREEAGCSLCVQHMAAWFRAKNAARQAAGSDAA
jgi:hypothetical protein